jgi:hypothetical protein
MVSKWHGVHFYLYASNSHWSQQTVSFQILPYTPTMTITSFVIWHYIWFIIVTSSSSNTLKHNLVPPINKCTGDTQTQYILLPLRINTWSLCSLLQYGSQYFIHHIARMDTNKSTLKWILRKLIGSISWTADRVNLKYSEKTTLFTNLSPTNTPPPTDVTLKFWEILKQRITKDFNEWRCWMNI